MLSIEQVVCEESLHVAGCLDAAHPKIHLEPLALGDRQCSYFHCLLEQVMIHILGEPSKDFIILSHIGISTNVFSYDGLVASISSVT